MRIITLTKQAQDLGRRGQAGGVGGQGVIVARTSHVQKICTAMRYAYCVVGQVVPEIRCYRIGYDSVGEVLGRSGAA